MWHILNRKSRQYDWDNGVLMGYERDIYYWDINGIYSLWQLNMAIENGLFVLLIERFKG